MDAFKNRLLMITNYFSLLKSGYIRSLLRSVNVSHKQSNHHNQYSDGIDDCITISNHLYFVDK
jgi:hypothetical protein